MVRNQILDMLASLAAQRWIAFANHFWSNQSPHTKKCSSPEWYILKQHTVVGSLIFVSLCFLTFSITSMFLALFPKPWLCALFLHLQYIFQLYYAVAKLFITKEKNSKGICGGCSIPVVWLLCNFLISNEYFQFEHLLGFFSFQWPVKNYEKE